MSERGLIKLNERQESTIKQWAADSPHGDLWGSEEARDINLHTFARLILQDLEKKEAVTRNTAVLQNARTLIGNWRQNAEHLRREYSTEHTSERARQLDECASQLELVLSEHDGQPESITEDSK
jgi:hypothetical protein